MAQTLNYLTEHKLLDYADLTARASEVTAQYRELSEKIKVAEKRMAETAVMKMILSILVDTFFSRKEKLSCNTERVEVSLSFKHRRKSVIGGTNPPVVPITHEVSPDKCFQFIH